VHVDGELTPSPLYSELTWKNVLVCWICQDPVAVIDPVLVVPGEVSSVALVRVKLLAGKTTC
jgi:hypothetical protein